MSEANVKRNSSAPHPAAERLRSLRDELDAIENPLTKWGQVEAIAARIAVMVRKHDPSCTPEFERVARTPTWAMIPRSSGRDAIADQEEERLNLDIAAGARDRIRAFLSGLIEAGATPERQPDRKASNTAAAIIAAVGVVVSAGIALFGVSKSSQSAQRAAELAASAARDVAKLQADLERDKIKSTHCAPGDVKEPCYCANGRKSWMVCKEDGSRWGSCQGCDLIALTEPTHPLPGVSANLFNPPSKPHPPPAPCPKPASCTEGSWNTKSCECAKCVIPIGFSEKRKGALIVSAICSRTGSGQIRVSFDGKVTMAKPFANTSTVPIWTEWRLTVNGVSSDADFGSRKTDFSYHVESFANAFPGGDLPVELTLRRCTSDGDAACTGDGTLIVERK